MTLPTEQIQLHLSDELQKALTHMGFTTLTPIQEQSIPPLMDGLDVIGQAQTGTGKTAAFAIPIIEQVDPNARHTQALILCPTRELAIQVNHQFQKLCKFKKKVRMLAIYGGQSIEKQMHLLKQQAPQIIVGTPGRVKDMIQRGCLKLDLLQTVVLDEADEMLNMGFRPSIEHILGKAHPDRQTVLFSATMARAVLDLTYRYQQNAVHIQVAPQEKTLHNIEQLYFETTRHNKPQILLELLEYHEPNLSLVFCNTKWKVDQLVDKLKKSGYQAEGLHGGKTQPQRDRIMKDFRKGKTRLLVATDVAARGLDINDVEAVFNFDLPKDREFYIHRIGRTGRAGKTGQSFTFAETTELQQLKDLRKSPNVHLKPGTLPSKATLQGQTA